MIHRLQSNRHSCFVVYKALQDQPARSYMHTLCIAVTVAKQTQLCSQTSNIRLTRYASCKCWQSCTLHACECACVSQHTLGWLLSNVIIKPGLCPDVQERHMTVQDVPAHVKTVVPAWTSSGGISNRQCIAAQYCPKPAGAA